MSKEAKELSAELRSENSPVTRSDPNTPLAMNATVAPQMQERPLVDKPEDNPEVDLERKPPDYIPPANHGSKSIPIQSSGWELVGEMLAKMASLVFQDVGVWAAAYLVTKPLRDEVNQPKKELENKITACDKALAVTEKSLKNLEKQKEQLKGAVDKASSQQQKETALSAYQAFLDGTPGGMLSYQQKQEALKSEKENLLAEKKDLKHKLAEIKPLCEQQLEIIKDIQKDLRGMMLWETDKQGVDKRRHLYDQQRKILAGKIEAVLHKTTSQQAGPTTTLVPDMTEAPTITMRSASDEVAVSLTPDNQERAENVRLAAELECVQPTAGSAIPDVMPLYHAIREGQSPLSAVSAPLGVEKIKEEEEMDKRSNVTHSPLRTH